MTVEQKRNAIEQHCYGQECTGCQLYGKEHCFTEATETEINENYTILFGDCSTDSVVHPSHYNQGGIECLEAMEAAYGKEATATFCLTNAFKYIWRTEHKNGIQDIDKAIWYLNKYKELKSSE